MPVTTQDADPKAVGSRIKHYRELAGLNQSQLAAKLGPSCTQSRVSRWEGGRVLPERDYVGRLCKVLGLTFEELWYGNRSSAGGLEVKNEEIRKALSPEWGKLSLPKRHALAELLNDADLQDFEARSILATLMRGWEKRGENAPEDSGRPVRGSGGRVRR